MKCANCGAQMELINGKYICSYCGNQVEQESTINAKDIFECNGPLLKKYLGLQENVIIPEGISEIANYAFKDNNFIKKSYVTFYIN